MKRRIAGLNSAADDQNRVPDGLLLVAVHRMLFINGQKPYFAIAFKIVQPLAYAGKQIQTRIYATERALWKLGWFLRDFGYDPQLMQEEQIDEKEVIGLRGVVRVSHVSINGRTFTNVDAFAPESTWVEGRFRPTSAAEHESEDERQA